jgi:hypothetical protein
VEHSVDVAVRRLAGRRELRRIQRALHQQNCGATSTRLALQVLHK